MFLLHNLTIYRLALSIIFHFLDLNNCRNENYKPYNVRPRITTNGAKNCQNGTRCSVVWKWALGQRTDQ